MKKLIKLALAVTMMVGLCFTSVSAARKGNADIAIGNTVGSNILNILFVIGISSVIIDVPFEKGFLIDTIVAVMAGVLLLACSLTKDRKLKRWAGILMLVCYAVYFVLLWNKVW